MRAGMPAAALSVYFASRVHLVAVHVAGLGAYPDRLGDTERNVMCRTLRLPGCFMPRLGHLELGLEWGWPRLPSLRGASVLELHVRARKTEQERRPILTLLESAQAEHRRFVQLADARPWDTRWSTPPLAQLLADAVSPPPRAHPAARALAVAADVRKREGKPIDQIRLLLYYSHYSY